MDDLPYTTADEDPFHVALPPPSAFPRSRPRRPTSLVDKWIRQQQRAELDDDPDHDPQAPTKPPSRAETPTTACPDLDPLLLDDDDSADSAYSYDLVDDDDLPNATVLAPLAGRTRTVLRRRRLPPDSAGVATKRRSDNLNVVSFETSASDDIPAPSSPRTSSRLSFFARPSNTDRSVRHHHPRSPSLSTLHMPPLSPPPASKWRPSILTHFSPSSPPPPPQPEAPPRPSLSSGDTSMSATTTASSDMPPTPSRPSFLESIRSRNRSSLSLFKAAVGSSTSISSPSRPNFDDILEAGPSSASPPSPVADPRRTSPFSHASRGQYDNLLDDDEEDLDYEHYVAPAPPPPPTHHKRESTRSSLSFSSHFGSLSSKAHRRKKRLVISGVGVHETRKFEGVKRWCENFGEIRQITRVANGDLHIDFRRPEVADTVCRVRAKVFIAGVGSVYLSWITGDKR